jgi:hypothetical protein
MDIPINDVTCIIELLHVMILCCIVEVTLAPNMCPEIGYLQTWISQLIKVTGGSLFCEYKYLDKGSSVEAEQLPKCSWLTS